MLGLEALTAEHRAPLGGLEGNGGFDATLGALSSCLGAREASGGGTGARVKVDMAFDPKVVLKEI